MNDHLEDYVDVAERIAAFFAKYPDGSLQPRTPWEVRDVAGHAFVVYEAAAYRTPDDLRPGIGTAWEPFPGPTQFTRNSELMNAETAAWGRAIVAVGRSSSRKIATREELENRQAENPPGEPAAAPAPAPEPKPKAQALQGASAAQRKKIHALIDEKLGGKRVWLETWLAEYAKVELEPGWMDRLSAGRAGSASRLIDALEHLAPYRESDVPSEWPSTAT